MKNILKESLAVDKFIATTLDIKLSRTEVAKADKRLIGLANQVIGHVPAYRSFLMREGLSKYDVLTMDDVKQLPLVTKDNYMRSYTLAERCWGGELANQEMIAVSSGSTGEPMFWPRSISHEVDVSYRFEQIFHDSFGMQERKTLAVVCFAMGTWVGGMFTAQCCRMLSSKGYQITLATPGNNKDEIYRVIKNLGGDFDQIILFGYPPFIRDVISAGRVNGLDWRDYALKLVFAGEVFSEEWRTLLCAEAGGVTPETATASLYGTADAGVVGNETELSITLRQHLAQAPEAAQELFAETRLPTLVQFDPNSRYFEVVDDTLVVSADNGVPLVRYHIADKGGVIPFAEMMVFADQHFPELRDVFAKARPLPFVYVFGRSDFTVSYYGANIYPENISVGLEQVGIYEWITGKFVMEVQERDEHNQLVITVELAPKEKSTDALNKKISESISRELLRLNSEFANYVPQEFQLPEVQLLPFADEEYFPIGVKHRYTR